MSHTNLQTSGQWEAALHPPELIARRKGWCIVGPRPDREIIASVYGGGSRALADARLLAAAPELLEALERSAESLCSFLCPSVKKTGEPWPHSQECEQVRAAIAKARGTDDSPALKESKNYTMR
ncbi:MAG: hypothetical protein HY231_24145 [Acidobacteria bacterium]|nr:hypothetical protein [Acidobacteriota bacterium]